VDRCALFVDAGYVLADGAMAVHGTRHRESVSWNYAGILQFLGNVARDRTGLPLLRCYWYEATVEGRRAPEHDALADLPGVKLRLGRMRPGRREGVEAEIHRDLTALARNGAVSDALLVSAEEDLAQVISDVQDLGIKVTIVHITVDGNWTISRALRQECDDIIEIGEAHLRPYVDLVVGAEPLRDDEHRSVGAYPGRVLTNGHGPVGALSHQHALPAGSHPAPAEIYTAPVIADYQRAAQPAVNGHPGPHQPNPPGQPNPSGPIGGVLQQGQPGSFQPNPPGQPNPSGPIGGVLRQGQSAMPGAQASTGMHAQPGITASQPAVPGQPAAHSQLTQPAAPAGPGMTGPPGMQPPPPMHQPMHQQPAAMQQAPGAAMQQAPPAPQPQQGHNSAAMQVPHGMHAQSATHAQSAMVPQPHPGQPGPPGTAGPAGPPGQPGMQPQPQQPGSAGHPGAPQTQAGTPGMPGGQPVYQAPPPTGYQGARPDGPMTGHPGPAGPAAPGGPAGPAGQQVRGGVRTYPATGPTGRFARPSDQRAPQQFPGAPTDPADAGSAYVPQQGPYSGPQPATPHAPVPQPAAVSLADAVQAAHGEGFNFGQSVARDAPALWLEAVLARKPRMPSDLEARLLQDSALPIDSLLHDEVRHALRRGFWDALERARH
jgi:hypothetical protein